MQCSQLSRRQVLKGVAAVGANLWLAACSARSFPGAQSPARDEQAVAPAHEGVMIRVLSQASQEEIDAATTLLDEQFTAQYPQIQVAVEAAPIDWRDRLEAQMRSGEAVDIFAVWGSILFPWSEGGLVLDVQDFVARDMTQAQIEDYHDLQWTGLWVRGQRLGMPRYINLVTVCVNVTMFERYGVELPPADGNWDHEDYAQLTYQLTQAARQAGNETFWGGWKPMWNWGRFWTTIAIFGGQVVDEKYGKDCKLDTPEAQAAIQWAYNLIWQENVLAQPAQVEHRGGHDALANGWIGYAEEGTYPLQMARLFEAGNVMWDLRHVPTGPAGIRKTLGTTDAWSITKQTEYAEEAWQVIYFLAGPVYQAQQVVAQEGRIPVLKSQLAPAIETLRQLHPSLAQVRLETIQEVFDWGYAEDTFWFHKQQAAYEILERALREVFLQGRETPDYFIKIAQQVDESQTMIPTTMPEKKL